MTQPQQVDKVATVPIVDNIVASDTARDTKGGIWAQIASTICTAAPMPADVIKALLLSFMFCLLLCKLSRLRLANRQCADQPANRTYNGAADQAAADGARYAANTGAYYCGDISIAA